MASECKGVFCRISWSHWKDKRGCINSKRSISILKRRSCKCSHCFGLLETLNTDIANLGVYDTLKMSNLKDVSREGFSALFSVSITVKRDSFGRVDREDEYSYTFIELGEVSPC